MQKTFLGIDTSNYRTSVALVDEKGAIIYNHRELLSVPEGKRGLRQSEAFFQHVQKLPDALKYPLQEYRDTISAIGVSTRPRPREGSYMPCFTAGYRAAEELSYALGVPLVETSHQEGHVKAVSYYSELRNSDDMIFYHFSGGTTEAIYDGDIVGGTDDISYGQVLDRVGVKLGYSFPSGEYLDRIALGFDGPSSDLLTPIKVKDGHLNLSGIESQASRLITDDMIKRTDDPAPFIKELMDKLADSIISMTDQLRTKFNTRDFIFSGGVSASAYIRMRLEKELGSDLRLVFGSPELSGDNAAGVALITMEKYFG